jgi:flagellar assembly factor FliW
VRFRDSLGEADHNMEINTTRFGKIDLASESILHFPAGLWGFEDCKDWVILADEENDALAWLQSTNRPAVALAMASPRRFVPNYQMHIARRELALLELEDAKKAQVLVIVGKKNRAMTLNLKAPVVINIDRRLGRQVITNGELPVQYELVSERTALRRTA